MDSFKIETEKLITQAAYAKKIGLTRGAVNHMIRDKRLKTVQIQGAVLVKLD